MKRPFRLEQGKDGFIRAVDFESERSFSTPLKIQDYIKIDDNGDIITPMGTYRRHYPIIDLLELTGKKHIVKTKKKKSEPCGTNLIDINEFNGTFKNI